MRVITQGKVHSAVILPTDLNIPVKISNGHVSFIIDKPVNCYLQINNNYVYPLAILAQPKEAVIDTTGIRYYAPGKVHEVGEVELHNNETVYIAQGAFVKGRFKAKDASNITIKGLGILEGTMFESGSGKEALLFQNCKNVRVEGITSIDPAFGNLVLNGCSDVTIQNFKAFGTRERRMTDDGLVISASTNVNANQLFFNTRNNSVAIQSSKEYGGKVYNVNISNGIFWKGDFGAVMEMSYLTKGMQASRISFTNIDVLHCLAGAVFRISPDQAQIRDVQYQNIRMRDLRFKLWQVSLDNADDVVENINFSNIFLNDSPIPYSDWENKKGVLKNIVIQNLQFNGNQINTANKAHFRNVNSNISFK